MGCSPPEQGKMFTSNTGQSVHQQHRAKFSPTAPGEVFVRCTPTAQSKVFTSNTGLYTSNTG